MRAAREQARPRCAPAGHAVKALAWTLLLSGCAVGVEQRLVRVHDTTVLARQRGAYECAPVLLAQAETRAELARIELSAGELVRAERETDRAEAHARAVLAAAAGCLGAAPPPPLGVAPPPPPR